MCIRLLFRQRKSKMHLYKKAKHGVSLFLCILKTFRYLFQNYLNDILFTFHKTLYLQQINPEYEFQISKKRKVKKQNYN